MRIPLNTGANPGGLGDGDTLRVSYYKCDANFQDLYATGSGLQSQITTLNSGSLDLSDPGDNRVLGWLDNSGSFAWLQASGGLTITGNFLTYTGAADYATVANLASTGANLQSQVTNLAAATGSYLTSSKITGAGTVTTSVSGSTVVVSGAAGGGGVTSLNSLTSAVTVSGAGIVAVTTNGQTIIVSGTATSGQASTQARTIGFASDGAGTTVTTGIKSYGIIPFGGTITSYTIASKQSGQLSLDIYKSTSGSLPTGSICGANFPSMGNQFKISSDLAGWTTSVSQWDSVAWVVRGATGVTQFSMQLVINPS